MWLGVLIEGYSKTGQRRWWAIVDFLDRNGQDLSSISTTFTAAVRRGRGFVEETIGLPAEIECALAENEGTVSNSTSAGPLLGEG